MPQCAGIGHCLYRFGLHAFLSFAGPYRLPTGDNEYLPCPCVQHPLGIPVAGGGHYRIHHTWLRPCIIGGWNDDWSAAWN